MLVIFFCQISAASGIKYNENEVKIAFLFRSLQYINWETLQSNDNDPITICSHATPAFSKLLESLDNRTVAERKIRILSRNSATNPDNCNVIYIQTTSLEEFKSTLDSFKNKPVLTINDNPDFSHRGAILNFITRNQRITIEVNMDMAKKSNIKFSAKYLRIANIIGNEN